jgi:hypothetical protein
VKTRSIERPASLSTNRRYNWRQVITVSWRETVVVMATRIFPTSLDFDYVKHSVRLKLWRRSKWVIKQLRCISGRLCTKLTIPSSTEFNVINLFITCINLRYREHYFYCLCGQSSWLQIQRSRFDFRLYQIFWEVVRLERGPLSLVSIFFLIFNFNF